MTSRKQPRAIDAKKKAYAFERSLGMPPAEACRRAGGNVDHGRATVWERSAKVQAWITHYRALGCEEEMLAAKRARIEERLALAAFGNIFEFAKIVDRVVTVQISEDVTEDHIVRTPLIDWDKVASSPYGAIITGFKFSKDTGELTDFERDNALQALAQLRDMHGFKAPARSELTGRDGGPIEVESLTVADRARALMDLVNKAGVSK